MNLQCLMRIDLDHETKELIKQAAHQVVWAEWSGDERLAGWWRGEMVRLATSKTKLYTLSGRLIWSG